MRRTTIGALAVLTVWMSAGPSPLAQATFPGPNGRIAFVRGGNVWVMDPNGTGQRRLTTSGRADNPHWSADGTSIAYDQGSAATGRDIWVMRGDGSGKYRVTTHARNETDPAWSPDGRWLAFVSDRRDRAEIFKIRSTAPFGTAVRLTATAGTGEPEPTLEDPRLSDGQPSWSPNGARIAFRRFSREDGSSFSGYAIFLMTMRADGTGLVQAGTPFGYDVTCPAWAPGGGRIAWVDDSWTFSQALAASNVWHSSADGSGTVAVTSFAEDVPWHLGCASWSPDRGRTIVFSGIIDDGSAVGNPRIYRVPSNGSAGPTRIAWNGADPDWGRSPA